MKGTIKSNLRLKEASLFEYNAYKKLVRGLLEEGKVTGGIQADVLLETTKMNLLRMDRIEKKNPLIAELVSAIALTKRKWIWYVLIEGWCADGAQNLPFIVKMVEASKNIELKLLLRDENPEIMKNYLTNGGKAIPKLICVDSETNEELGIWGPRPKEAQEFVVAYKKVNPEMEKMKFAINLHRWYAKDKGVALQKEFLNLVAKWNQL